jgi:hypothetical protein
LQLILNPAGFSAAASGRARAERQNDVVAYRSLGKIVRVPLGAEELYSS